MVIGRLCVSIHTACDRHYSLDKKPAENDKKGWNREWNRK